MNSALKLHRGVGLAVFVLTLGMYIVTMAPTVSFWDCGEFIACSHILGVPHPPGSPLYVLLGRVFTLFPIDDVASRIVFMSALASALAVAFTYLSAVALARRALGGVSLQPLGDARDYGATLGGAVAALCLAFSYTFWFNATEAEVYAYSLFFACGSLWLIIYWEGTQHGAQNDRWLYFIAYFFGLGGGLHLLCLLTIPSLVLLAWFADRKLRRLVLMGVGLGLTGLSYLTLFASQTPSAQLMALLSALAAILFYGYIWSTHGHLRDTVRVLVAVGLAALVGRALLESVQMLILAACGAALLYHLFRVDRRAFALAVGTGFLFALGYSTYTALFIRSGLDPAIDMNDPENWGAFLKFLNREQYGTDSQLLGMLTGRASRTYQFWHQQMKYFFQQFPFPLLERNFTFRWATENAPHIIAISPIPILLGVFGFGWHLKADWRRFLAFFALLLIMGIGLSFYLNMPDPQPRERHYVFGGMFLAFALWMGLGWTGLVELARQRFQLGGRALLLAACLGLLVPAGIAARHYHIQDRTGDFIAYDYAYNLLSSCEPDGILFTNGDNDTFPLWFLQEVEGVRRDVRVVNLSLLNTSWYIKQLRDREPHIRIDLKDTFIDSVLTDTQTVDLYRRLWREPRTPREYADLGLDVKVGTLPGHDLLRIQDYMVIGIIHWNWPQRPVHFAITVASSNRTGLDQYLRMDGMTMTLVPEKGVEPDAGILAHNLMEVYQYRGISDPSVYKDVNTARLLGNYRACIMTLADAYQRTGRAAELADLFGWATRTIPLSWEGFYTASEHYREAGQNEQAVSFLQEAAEELFQMYGLHPSATYDNALALASIFLNTYRDYERAETLYRRAIAKEPERYDGYHELAATLQAGSRVPEAFDMVVAFQREYGPTDTSRMDSAILENALQKRRAAAAGESTGDSAAAGAVPAGDDAAQP